MRFTPGPLVAAAFIGPGTVTTATLAGAEYGYVLLWGIVASAIATVILQEMAMRIGVVGRRDLGAAIRDKLSKGASFYALATLTVLAIGAGNAAYEGGNLAGAAIGLELLTGGALGEGLAQAAVAGAALALLLVPRPSAVRGALTAAVVIMTGSYFWACAVAPVDWTAVLASTFRPRLPTGAEWTLVGLVGTTIVPYNLFLHASTARDFYAGEGDIAGARLDLYASVGIGAAVTLAVAVLAASGLPGGPALARGADLVTPLAGVLGAGSQYVVGLGYFAAGLTSAVTAPLAAALAFAGLFAWEGEAAIRGRRLVTAAILGIGIAMASSGYRPVPLIVAAQVANGILLPVIAGIVLWIANDGALLRQRVNGRVANALGAITLTLTVLLAVRIFATW